MSGTETATIAAGCFWGVEHLYRKNFGNGKGLLDAKVGYCGGATAAPSYRSVCSGATGRKSNTHTYPHLIIGALKNAYHIMCQTNLADWIPSFFPFLQMPKPFK
jgi:hypothetical protein